MTNYLDGYVYKPVEQKIKNEKGEEITVKMMPLTNEDWTDFLDIVIKISEVMQNNNVNLNETIGQEMTIELFKQIDKKKLLSLIKKSLISCFDKQDEELSKKLDIFIARNFVNLLTMMLSINTL